MDTQTVTEQQSVGGRSFDPFVVEIEYPESHDDDMGESTLHYELISYIFHALRAFFASEGDVAIAANLNLYYQEGQPRRYYTPDVMVAFGASRRDRHVYKLWEEGVFPQVVFEVASGQTWKNDLGEKAEFYDYLIDPEREYLPQPLMAFHREKGRLMSVPIIKDRILSPLLNLEVVDTEESFRLFDPNSSEFLKATLTA